MSELKACLEFFAGEWTGEEEIAPSKWGEGGRATASVSSQLDLGGRVLVQDYSAQRGGMTWLKAHAVITFDEQTSRVGLFWFDSLGFTPGEPAPGEWDGWSLRFVRTSPRGLARHTYTPSGSQAYDFMLESSFDAGASWVLVMKGRYIRANSE
ncbi:DUF1579 family protein [Pseudoduganella sp. S-14]|uniref:DUF1579 family protein n=1 Tax=Pseudoduganella sp. S-14 TaxID=3404065 RepID=UPI003CF74D54